MNDQTGAEPGLEPCREALNTMRNRWEENAEADGGWDEALQDLDATLASINWNRRAPEAEVLPDLGEAMALSVLETRCAVTEGMYATLRAGVEKVHRDANRRMDSPGTESMHILELTVIALTALLDGAGTEEG